MRTTKEDMEGSGGGDKEHWLEGGFSESRQVDRQSASNCKRNGVNPATSAKGTTLDKN